MGLGFANDKGSQFRRGVDVPGVINNSSLSTLWVEHKNLKNINVYNFEHEPGAEYSLLINMAAGNLPAGVAARKSAVEGQQKCWFPVDNTVKDTTH
jgi:hypothetical protein